MTSSLYPGHPVRIFSFNEGNAAECDSDVLESILMNEHVKNRKIVVLSIIGAFRKGKSFLLDYCLRYMYANVRKNYLASQ